MTGGYVEKSFAPAPADLEAIGAFTRRAFAPEELYVFSVVLCNNDVDRDHESLPVGRWRNWAPCLWARPGSLTTL